MSSKDWPVGESAVSESVCLTAVVTAPPPSKRCGDRPTTIEMLSKRRVLQHVHTAVSDATKPHAKQKTNASHVLDPHVA